MYKGCIINYMMLKVQRKSNKWGDRLCSWAKNRNSKRLLSPHSHRSVNAVFIQIPESASYVLVHTILFFNLLRNQI